MRILYLVVIIFACSCNAQNLKKDQAEAKKTFGNLKNYGIKLSRLVDSLKINKADLSILITKSKYTLSIMKDNIIIKTYPVVLGFNPKDDKLKEGDGCTPEGKFKIKEMNPHKKWSRFIWFDYPNEESWTKHKLAEKKGQIPKDSDIGGEVGIHGVPKGTDDMIDEKENWTLGCISLKNKDIIEVYDFSFIGMGVEIIK
jgi:murein L,D-transpeptidase YafK